MKIAVFNRWWATYGGGERYAGALAQALATDHDVDLLAPTPVDWDRLEERLGLDLSRTSPRAVPEDPFLLSAITREYDLLVTSSFMSAELNEARRGIYVVLFPGHDTSRYRLVKRAGARLLGPMLGEDGVSVLWGRGFHPLERSGRRLFRWTGDRADLQLTLPAGVSTRVRLTFMAFRPRDVAPATVLVEVDGRVLARTTVGADLRPVDVAVDLVGHGSDEPIELVIRTDTFSLEDRGGDGRRLGVPLSAVQVGPGARAWLLGNFPFLADSRRSLDFLETYHRVVSISEFTRRWVQHRWGRESHVIHPPVDFESGEHSKDQLILSVGRFFGERYGHSKKQLEMVRAFRTLVAGGLTGWELHLVGSCQAKHAEYLARVRAEADGLPVHFHIDASGAALNALYRRASIYWHAAGLGESERRHPERLEHFGITTVEAMGAGAVPIVIGKAGQTEIVQRAVNGHHFQSLAELVARTRLVTGDAELRRRLSAAARQRATEFSTEKFAERVRALVADVASA
jgi:glycosyltransferase involved in cell wall biosynthesis